MTRRHILAAFWLTALAAPAFAQSPAAPAAPAAAPSAPAPSAPVSPAAAQAAPAAPSAAAAPSGAVAPSTSAAPAAPAAAPSQPPAIHLLPRSEAIPVLGQDVATADGSAVVGRLIDVLVDADGQPRAAVLDVGGFMGMGSRDVSVQWAALHFAPDKPHPITTTLTPDQIRAAPEYKNSDKPAAVVTPSKS